MEFYLAFSSEKSNCSFPLLSVRGNDIIILFADFPFLCSLPFPHSSGEEAEEEEGTIIFIIAEAPGLLHSGLIVNGHLGHP